MPRSIRLYCAIGPGCERIRAALKTTVWPRLKDVAARSGCRLTIVDLREGAPDGEEDEIALRWGLAEIDRCSPFFVAVAGPDAGPPPRRIPAEASAFEPWVMQARGASVFELELRRAAERPGGGFVPRLYLLGQAGMPNRRSDLAAFARDHGMDVQECGPEADALAARMVVDLETALAHALPSGGQELTPLQEADLEWSRNRRCVFVPRRDTMKRLSEHVAGEEPPLLLTAAPGSGVSTLLAGWAAEYVRDNPSVPVVAIHLETPVAEPPDIRIWKRIVIDIKQRLGCSLPLPETDEEWRSEGPEWLHIAAAHGRIVILLDGLHHAADADGCFRLDWLWASWPRNIRFILALRPDQPPIDLFSRRGWPSLPLPDPDRPHRAEFLTAWLADLRLDLPRAWIDRSQTAQNPGFAFTAVTLLHEARLLGTSGSAARYLNDCLATAGPVEMTDAVLARIERDCGRRRCLLVRDALSLIAVSSGGLAEDDLVEILASEEDDGRLPASCWQPVRWALAPFLEERGGRLVFSNGIVTAAVRARYLLSEAHEISARQRIIGHLCSRRLLTGEWSELASHLVAIRSWEGLYRLLAEARGFGDLATVPAPLVAGLWRKLEENSSFRLLEAASRVLLEPVAWKPHLGTWAGILAAAGLPGKAITLQIPFIDHLRETGEEEAVWGARETLAELFMEIGEFARAETILAELARAPVPGGRAGAARIALRRSLIAGSCGRNDLAAKQCRESRRLFREAGDPFGQEVALGHLAGYLYAQSDLGGAKTFYAEQEQICRSIGRLSGLVRALHGQALILRAWGDLETALNLLHESEEICRRMGYRERLADALNQRAAIVRTHGRIDLSLELYQEAEAICVETVYRDGLQTALGGQASIRRIRGDLDEATRLFQEQERLCRLINKKDGLQISLCGHAVILRDRGRLDEAKQLLKEAERLCREIGYREGLPRILGNMASICLDRGELGEAQQLLRESERICRDLNLRAGLQRVLEQLALVLKGRGELDGALALLREQEKICRQLGIKIGLQVSLGHQAHILYFRGEVEAAMTLFREQERICRELGLRDRLHIALGGQAVIFRARGDWKRSMELLREQEAICRELGLRSGLQVSLYNQGVILLIRGDQEGAMALFKQQEAVCREAGYREGLQAALGSQAVVLRNRGDLEGSMALFREQERICRESGYKEGLQVSLCGQAAILQARDEFDAALQKLREGERICRELGHREGLQRVLCSMSVIFERRGELDTAMTLLGEVEHICRALDYKSGLQRALEYMAGIHKTRGDTEMAMKLLKEQEAICRELGIKAGLQACIGRQAQIMQTNGEMEGAMALFREQEAICRELGLKAGLVKALAAQASLLGRRFDTAGEAVQLMKEAWGMARSHGLVALSDQIATVLDTMRKKNSADTDGEPVSAELWEKIQHRLIERVAFIRPDDDPQTLLDRLQAHERVSRDLGMLEEVAHSLAGQSYAHRMRGELDKALQKLRDEEAIWRRRENKPRLAECLTQQALLLAIDMKRLRDALAPAEEAARLTAAHDLLEISGDVLARLLERIRAGFV
ncbi:MAG TPA: tetratricopeptide repeat protein [Candidatus Ozemobacteraceae bacterium]|nr:tetratricopeptide repeat protein [Candidatus Ozemobacteraceae bacterium]